MDLRYLLVHNQEGMPVLLTVEGRKQRRKSWYEVTGSCKRFPTDGSCICMSGDDACKCNWLKCFWLKGQPGDKLPAFLKMAADRCQRVTRCMKCEDLVPDEAEFGRLCASCWLQKLLPSGKPTEDCPICLEAMHPTDSVTLSCHHMLHVHCARKMLRPEADMKCPLCRSEVADEVVLDHVPPCMVCDQGWGMKI